MAITATRLRTAVHFAFEIPILLLSLNLNYCAIVCGTGVEKKHLHFHHIIS